MEAELKALTDDIVNGYLGYINSDILRDVIYSFISESYKKGLEEAEITFNQNFVPNNDTVQFLQKFGFDNVTKLTDDMKDALRKEISLGLMNHETIPQLKIRIMDVMNTTIERAEMIVRTETVRAFNYGHYQAAKDSGLQLVKQWLAAEDERMCETCGFLDGQTIEMNNKFKASDGKEYFSSPAHPNCRCRVLYIQKP